MSFKTFLCFTNLLESLDLLTNALKKGKTVNVIYTDYAKAIDKVCPTKLVQKVEPYGKALTWIESFLTGRMIK